MPQKSESAVRNIKQETKKHNIQDNLKFYKVNFCKQKAHCILLNQLTNDGQDLTSK